MVAVLLRPLPEGEAQARGTVVEELDLELSFGEPKPSERNAGIGANAFESEEVLSSGAPLLLTDT